MELVVVVVWWCGGWNLQLGWLFWKFWCGRWHCWHDVSYQILCQFVWGFQSPHP